MVMVYAAGAAEPAPRPPKHAPTCMRFLLRALASATFLMGRELMAAMAAFCSSTSALVTWGGDERGEGGGGRGGGGQGHAEECVDGCQGCLLLLNLRFGHLGW